jgi:hypothetical protein
MTRNSLLKTALAVLVGVAAGCGGPQANNDIAQVTFDVTVPADTPAGGSVYVIGTHPNLGNNSNDAGLKLRRDPNSATKFRGSVYLPKGAAFLFHVRLKDPSAAELDAKDQMVDPRTLVVGEQDFTQTITVAKWNVPAETVHPKSTFVVTVPSNTPADAELWMVGNQPEIGNWNNANALKLTKGGDGKYRVTLEWAATSGTVEYKYLREAGTWDKEEVTVSRDPIQNRTFTIPSSADATKEDSIARWKDLPAP